MKKRKFAFLMLVSFSFILFAEETINEGKEIENLLSAVKAANPGDYILLPSGKRYVLTREEISIVKGEFDYEDLSEVATETLDDGTEIKTISRSHTAYIHPDGQSTHILKTSVSFTAFMRHIDDTYFITYFIDDDDNVNDYAAIDSPEFNVFRASVQFQTVSDGIEELQALTITVYNYDEKNFIMKYCEKPDMIWGNISDKGTYKPVGETHKIEFDVE
jgi:hypothetical protein